MPYAEDDLIIQTARSNPDVNHAEEKVVEQHTSLRPYVVHETVVRQGKHELARSNSALAWSGLAAGLSIGLSFIAEGLLRAHLPVCPGGR